MNILYLVLASKGLKNHTQALKTIFRFVPKFWLCEFVTLAALWRWSSRMCLCWCERGHWFASHGGCFRFDNVDATFDVMT